MKKIHLSQLQAHVAMSGEDEEGAAHFSNPLCYLAALLHLSFSR